MGGERAVGGMGETRARYRGGMSEISSETLGGGPGEGMPAQGAAGPGGAESHRAAAPARVRVAVVTVSDTRTPDTDQSGQYLVGELGRAGHLVSEALIVPDDAVPIRTALVRLMRQNEVILTTGGTGIAGRDVTVPVVESLLVKPIPGFGELFRWLSYEQVGGAAMLSRATGGLGRGALIFALPGSVNAVRTAWEGLLRDELPHLVYEMVRQGQGPAFVGRPGTLAPPAEELFTDLPEEPYVAHPEAEAGAGEALAGPPAPRVTVFAASPETGAPTPETSPPEPVAPELPTRRQLGRHANASAYERTPLVKPGENPQEVLVGFSGMGPGPLSPGPVSQPPLPTALAPGGAARVVEAPVPVPDPEAPPQS